MKLPWQRRRTVRDESLDEEIRTHFAMAVADRIARGESPEAALAAARREFGNVAHVKEVTREMWGAVWVERLEQDLHFAVRSLRRSPVFAGVAVLTLALGIGVDTAMFTVMNGVLLRPLPFLDPDALYVASYQPPRGPFSPFPGLYDVHYLKLLENNPIFARIATYGTANETLLGVGEPRLLSTAQVTTDFFGVLGVAAARGRLFTVGDAPVAGEGSVAILSDAAWRRYFAADSNILGKSVTLQGARRTIVGIMPETFEFPARTEVWVPLTVTTSPHRIQLRPVIGRLKAGLNPDAARAALTAVAAQFDEPGSPSKRTFIPELLPLKNVIVGDARRPLLIFGGAVLFVLLIACANVANLLLMRVASRDREMAVRAALGAGRARLMRQVLTETFAMSLLAAAVGLGLAGLAVRLLLAFAPADSIPRAANVHLSGNVLLFSVFVSIVTTLLCGIVPAVHATEGRLRASLAAGARTVAGSHARLRSVLVVGEMALALVLLMGAGLMLRTFSKLRTVDLGFHAGALLTATVVLPSDRYTAATAMREYHRRVLADLARMPNVREVAAVNWLPLGAGLITGDFHVENGPAHSPDYRADKMVVSPGYFRALGIRVERGRAFTDQDVMEAPKVILVSRTIADRFWPGGNAVGKRLTVVDQPTADDWLTIVGVVNDVVQLELKSEPDPAIYQPLAQTPQSFFLEQMTFLVRPAGSAKDAATAMRQTLRAVDPQLPIESIVSYSDRIASTTNPTRFQSAVLVTFAVLATVLAIIGIYGVLAYGVDQRRHELGVRMALGATRLDVMSMVLRRTMTLTVPGLLIGVAVSLMVTRVLSSFLFRVSPTDPVTLVSVAGLLGLAALLAAYAPARRASRLDPVIALRNE